MPLDTEPLKQLGVSPILKQKGANPASVHLGTLLLSQQVAPGVPPPISVQAGTQPLEDDEEELPPLEEDDEPRGSQTGDLPLKASPFQHVGVSDAPKHIGVNPGSVHFALVPIQQTTVGVAPTLAQAGAQPEEDDDELLEEDEPRGSQTGDLPLDIDPLKQLGVSPILKQNGANPASVHLGTLLLLQQVAPGTPLPVSVHPGTQPLEEELPPLEEDVEVDVPQTGDKPLQDG